MSISFRGLIYAALTIFILSTFLFFTLGDFLIRGYKSKSREDYIDQIFSAIEAGPLALSRLHAADISQKHLERLVTNWNKDGTIVTGAIISSGDNSSFIYAKWSAQKTVSKKCYFTVSRTYSFLDALNPYLVNLGIDLCAFDNRLNAVGRKIKFTFTTVLGAAFLAFFILSLPIFQSLSLAYTALRKTDGNISSEKIWFLPIRNLVNQARRATDWQKAAAQGEIAKQVAHDIRSPLSALDMVVATLRDIPEDKRTLIRNASQRIKDIANNLLDKNKTQSAESARDMSDSALNLEIKTSTQLISNLIDSILSEKRTQFREKIGIHIFTNHETCAYGLFAKVDATKFKSVISNLVNNSVEAIPDERGEIELGIEKISEKKFSVFVRDDGKGIPQEILCKLGEKGATYGKSGMQSGSGIGLYDARTTIESWGGRLEIESQPGKGAKFSLVLPRQEPPIWFLPQIEIIRNTVVLVLDDDISIHQVWQGRLQEYKVEILSISDPVSFRKLVQKQDAKIQLFLCDYELIDHCESGLDLIEEFGLQDRSILVTSRFEDELIRGRCEKLGVKCLPKSLANLIPLVSAT